MSEQGTMEGGRGLSRRSVLVRAAALGLAAAVGDLPAVLLRHDTTPAEALDLDLIHDTMSGLVAFAGPRDDAYSRAQGEHAPEPGGIAAGAAEAPIGARDPRHTPLP